MSLLAIIMVHTARISDVDSVIFENREGQIVSFELGKKNIMKHFFRLVTSMG